ncbi:FAD-binding oxidoreductase [Streptomyces sp. WMMB 322]|uniref:FAD-binding oxidoreductase n=1 Tax=Streptomyces sp. WMMB 322 TaxID=1286821 RepID=UPI000823C130|nr:FAD-binding oxidoreductase [Streptomyces sp. WMMB 322]SCK44368.1 glycolate oxidase FAD binding subunit [Streptomyces sp. WMMB 322]
MTEESSGTPVETTTPTDAGPDRAPPPAAERGSGAGEVPVRVRPSGLAEASEALAVAARERRTVLFEGAGTALEWGAPVARTGLVLETSGMDRLISHAPEDWTVGVEAGMPLTRLQELLAPAGQWLPVDPPTGSRGATLGGLLACGDAGPWRLKYGGLADLVIGATLVLADGTVARTGGDVIKNVAGYDLVKLMAGSLGAFGLVARLNLRVHPLPAATTTLALAVDDAGRALSAARAVMSSPLEPVAVEWDGQQLLIRFQGTEESATERGRLAPRVPGLEAGRVLGAEAERAAWQRLSALVHGADGETVLRAGTHPARLPALTRRLHDLTEGTGVEAALVSGVAQGLHTVVLRGGDAAEHAECLTAWRESVHEAGGSVTLRRRREGVDTAAASWGPAPSAVAVLRSLKRRFDPDDRCAPGRFAPWF